VSRVVCNTGPLIALGILGKLNLLRNLWTEVFIPEAVRTEVEKGGAEQLGLVNFKQADWIRVIAQGLNHDALLESLLDEVEACVIGLALANGIDTVIIDERKARKVARDVYQLQVIGTARILVESKRNGSLAMVAPCFEKLRQEGYWIHESIVRFALAEAGETS
jgi:predicted nucleic acid-binding protein